MAKQLIKASWLFLTIAALAFTLFKTDDQNKDLPLVLVWVMMVLCFPASLLAPYAHAVILVVPQNVVENLPQSVLIFTSWFIFFIIGYVQWFVLLPHLIRKWRKRNFASTAQRKDA